MIYGITYTDAHMTISAERCAISMVKMGCDYSFIRTIKDIPEDFIVSNPDIFTGGRGAGAFWLWKPKIIYDEILKHQDGDIICYSDAGVEFVADIMPLVEQMKEDVFLFNNRWNHIDWCKWDVIDDILHWQHDTPGIADIPQLHASNMFFRVSPGSKRFVKEWLMRCQLPGVITDEPSILPNVPTFSDHRHDQAVIASMAIRDKIKLHWFPCKTNMDRMQEGDNYPACMLHHRMRNEDY